MVDYKTAFAAIRKDSAWKRKIGLGMLISLIPYLGMVWMLGWQMQYQRNVAWGSDERLPDWSDFSGQTLLGLIALIAVLPYSLALSVLVTPMMIAVPLLSGLLANSDPTAVAVSMAAVAGASFFSSMALTVLILPFTASTTLRVALYGTLESGFQFKEIRRLMKKQKPELMKAWRFSTFNIGISFGVTILFLGAIALAFFALLPGSSELGTTVVLVLGIIGYFSYIVFSLALSLYLGLANVHYFGTYGRLAYRLDEARAH